MGLLRRGILLYIVAHLIGAVISQKELDRRRDVPVIFVQGSYYEIGYDVGRTFSSLIKEYIRNYEGLRGFEKEYKTEAGLEVYNKTLANMRKRFPYYVKEIQGVADGAGVPFYQLLLLHLDDIIDTINENRVVRKDTGGCSSVAINTPEVSILGHTEDADIATLNHFYIMSAHVIPDDEDRQSGAVEERFASLCYAGQLPGYTSGFNRNGLVFSINTLSPRSLKPGNTPRTFITRALLGARDFDDAKRILQDEGLGIANGFSLNMIWTDAQGHRKLFNAEVAPDFEADHSLLDIHKYENASESLVHCNKYQRLRVPEVRGSIIDSSVARLATIDSHGKPHTRSDIEDILSDNSGKEYRVFQDRVDSEIQTIAANVFDLEAMTWSIYINQPNTTEPVAVLPITFSKLNLKN